jgi:large subunit ribosomal protein L10
MNKNRTLKAETVESFRDALSGQEFAVVVQATGLTVAQVSKLRGQIRAAGAGYRVVKNTLARIALKGTTFEGLTPLMKGPTAIAYAKDPVAIAKVLVDFSKTNANLKPIGANLNGQMLDANAVKTLATLPSLNELRAKLVGMLQTPATRMAVLLKAPAGQIARVLSAKAKKES